MGAYYNGTATSVNTWFKYETKESLPPFCLTKMSEIVALFPCMECIHFRACS